MARTANTVPAKPFADWLNARVHRYSGMDEMARSFGVAVRTLHRYMACKMETKENGKNVVREADDFNLESVEEMLHRAGFFLWDVYDEKEFPELYSFGELRPIRGFLYEDLLLEAKRLHDDFGMAITEIAEELRDRSGGRTVEGLRLALLREFRNQGWSRRSYSEITKQRWEDGEMILRPCEAFAAGGHRCGRAGGANGLCRHHDPAAREETISSINRARDGWLSGPWVPVAPFQEWLQGRVADTGGVRAYARLIGRHERTVSLWLRGEQAKHGGGTRKITEARKATIERLLEADGTATLDDLYSEQVAA